MINQTELNKLKAHIEKNKAFVDNIKSEKEIFELFSNEFNSCFYLEYFKNKNVSTWHYKQRQIKHTHYVLTFLCWQGV